MAGSLGLDQQARRGQETRQSGKPSEAPGASSDGWAAFMTSQRRQPQEPQAGVTGSDQAGGGHHRSSVSRPWGGLSVEADRQGAGVQSCAAPSPGVSPSFCQPGTAAFKFGESGDTAGPCHTLFHGQFGSPVRL